MFKDLENGFDEFIKEFENIQSENVIGELEELGVIFIHDKSVNFMGGLLMLFKSADRELEDLGFVKECDEDNKESKYGVSYIKNVPEYNYKQILSIMCKSNGRHLIQSYEEKVNSDGFNNCVGLTYKEMKAAMQKYREMKRKYRWE